MSNLQEIEDKRELEQNDSMSFLEHLEELRWRIIYSLIGVVIATIVCWFFIDFLINVVLLKPAKDNAVELQNFKPFGQIFVYIGVAVVFGVILSLPNLFYQFWKFISPALKEKERKNITLIVFFSTLCFLVGVCFAYFVMLPFSLRFAVNFGTTIIENNFAINEYLSLILSIIIGTGLVFELPVITFFLTKVGLLKPQYMIKYRRYSLIIILILSAFLTPSDIVSQVLLAIPLTLLYEISIFISKVTYRKNG